MDIVQAVLLALIQGLTEFLPISSSAHLILPSEVLGWPDQGIEFDVAVHVGTLAAVMLYFRKDVLQLITGWFAQFPSRSQNPDSQLAWCILVATVPVGLVGILFESFISEQLRSALVIATASLVFGLLLWYVDRRHDQEKTLAEMTLYLALLIGIAQAFALIPGTSRSGVTITMALLLGFTRVDSARFSFLLSIPVIISSGLLEGMKLADAVDIDWLNVIVGMLVSCVSAFICIHYFLAFISRLSMLPFVIYRIILSLILFGLVFSGTLS